MTSGLTGRLGASAGSADLSGPEPFDVVVVGSLNHDLGLPVVRTPRPGETVVGGDAVWSPGGKGANQAVGCARLGLRTAMVGALGDDASAAVLRRALRDDHVDVEYVRSGGAAPTGMAAVIVDGTGESTIVVSPGMNGLLDRHDVERAAPHVRAARALLCQLEVPLEAVTRAVELAQGLVVLNPAPGRTLPAALLQRIDLLVPNRHELALLLDAEVPVSPSEVAELARRLEGPGGVVVTLGADGAVVFVDGVSTHVPAIAVTAVDTTGAGDSFCAGLLAGLLDGDDLVTATHGAVRVGAATVTRRGAMASLPRRGDVEARLRT